MTPPCAVHSSAPGKPRPHPLHPQVAFNDFNAAKGALTSLSQTKFLDPARARPIPKATAQPRFTTRFYAQYVA